MLLSRSVLDAVERYTQVGRNDIIARIADMDADVIAIETPRSDMELIDAFIGRVDVINAGADSVRILEVIAV